MKHVLQGLSLLISYKKFERNKNLQALRLQKFNIIYLNLYKSKWVLARRFILTYFSSQNISNFIGSKRDLLYCHGSKTMQIHCYYRISQEESTSMVTFQTII